MWVLLGSCTFDAPKGAPIELVLGAPCTDDRDCASHVCTGMIGSPGECVECRAGTACSEGRSCDVPSGRCLPDAKEELVHATTVGGERRTNAEGRVHVGRVAVVPVTTVKVSP